MNTAEFKRLLISVTRLTLSQKSELLVAANAGGHDEEVRSILESRLVETLACSHCNATWVVCNGSASGLPRYKCRACQRTFNSRPVLLITHTYCSGPMKSQAA